MHPKARKDWSSSSLGFELRFYSRVIPLKKIVRSYWTSNKDGGAVSQPPSSTYSFAISHQVSAKILV